MPLQQDSVVIAPDDRVFVLTGAGISAESGLATFRDSDGLWAGYNIEEVCTPQAWQRNPALVWEFYSARRISCYEAQPNPAHHALAKLEQQLAPERFFLCTQNVDDLHERAGSKRLLHMHGELNAARCDRDCGHPPVEDRTIYTNLGQVAHCPCGGRLRPHIVFFGEMPLGMDEIDAEIACATVMIVVGTSGAVYPAANFVHAASRYRARTVYIGPEPPLNAAAFSQYVRGKAGEVLPGLFRVE